MTKEAKVLPAVGSAAVARAGEAFAGESLRPPFVPEALAAAFAVRGAAVFGTRDAPTGLYTLEHFVAELAEAAVEDYLLLGFDGHGIASNALHYYLVCGPLAAFVQLNHANPFADEALSLRRIDATLALLETLFKDITQAERDGRLPAGARLVVIESDFFSCRWGWAPKAGTMSLTEAPDALLSGLLAVKALLGDGAAPSGQA